MRACVLVKRDGRTSTEIRELADPTPAAGEIVLAVRAAALNHLDLYAFEAFAGDDESTPRIIGSDAAGVVSAVGPGVDAVRIGDEVVLNPGLSCGDCEACQRGQASECPWFDIVGRGPQGTLAGFVTVPVRNVHPKPSHLNFDQAAALPLAHLTAARMLFERGRLIAGESVLIHGIGGGVALAALQLAKLAGAEVSVTSSSVEKLERAMRLGADHIVDYSATADVAESVRQVTGGRGVDLTVDTVGSGTLASSVSATRNGGRVVACGATSGAESTLNIRELFWRQISIIGSTMGSHEDFRRMLRIVTTSWLVPVIDSVLPLDEVAGGLARMRQGRHFGKIVISIDSRKPGSADDMTDG